MSPPPIPVPSDTNATSVAPRAAPTCHSASAPQVASFSTVTALPTSTEIEVAISRSATPSRLGAARRMPSFVTKPGTPTPTDLLSPTDSSMWLIAPIIVGTSAATLPAPLGVDNRHSAITLLSSSIATARHFVPPTSTPILRPRTEATQSPFSEGFHAVNGVENSTLCTTLHKAWQWHCEFNLKVVPNFSCAISARCKRVCAVNRPLNIT